MGACVVNRRHPQHGFLFHGKALFDLAPGYEYSCLNARVLQPSVNSRSSDASAPTLVLIGSGENVNNSFNSHMLLMRLDAAGGIDAGFGPNGHQAVFFNQAGSGPGSDAGYTGTMVGNGCPVMAGMIQMPADPDDRHEYGVARLLVGDGVLHGDFEQPF